jgi:hypothetical protein
MAAAHPTLDFAPDPRQRPARRQLARDWLAVLLLVCLPMLVVLTLAGFYLLRTAGRQPLTEVAMQRIGQAVGEAFIDGRELTPEVIDDVILRLHRAGDIQIGVGPDGEPQDLYGNPIQVLWAVGQSRLVVTCSTAGADGIPGSADDIAVDHVVDLATRRR